jgi:hypothetical protein
MCQLRWWATVDGLPALVGTPFAVAGTPPDDGEVDVEAPGELPPPAAASKSNGLS